MKLWYVEAVLYNQDEIFDESAALIVSAKGVIEAGLKGEQLAITHYGTEDSEWVIAEEIETHEELESLIDSLGDELIFEPGLFEEKGA
ncbi:hypothetical protein H1164_17155 [Thermoactinomyces daqus]|uniref:Uncharacterized protein n=1 Tax=Thermoactinomyces daqus TaxID=1329516 RepID=A0A7W2AJL7_9BACL|nr:hypothetical protein [Thermoactinomyces daqus]MBA4544560.1 hypothetical protein [Thermoactinomyces daqus]